MGDIMLCEKNYDDLEGLLSTLKRFSEGIGIQFGLEKCAKIIFVVRPINISLPQTFEI